MREKHSVKTQSIRIRLQYDTDLKLSDIEFKITVIHMLSDLIEKYRRKNRWIM